MVRNQSLVAAAFAAIACSSGALAASEAFASYLEARPVRLSLQSFELRPKLLHLKAGRPILLMVSNDSSIAHDLSAPGFFAHAAMSPLDRAKLINGKIALRPSQSVTLSINPQAGRYAAKCSHPFHKMLGMSGMIVVDP